jgi:hypothetical protein
MAIMTSRLPIAAVLVATAALAAGCFGPPAPRLDADHVKGRLVSDLPAGWKVRGPRVAVRPEGLGVFIDYEISRGGVAASILSIDATNDDWGTLMQNFFADDYRGKRVRFSAWVKAWRVSGWAGLWMRVDTESREMVAYDDMEGRAIRGTSDWTRYEVVLDVDEYAYAINVGIVLWGVGQVWMDDCAFEVVDESVPVTDQFPLGRPHEYSLPKRLYDEPVNLNFDEESIQ